MIKLRLNSFIKKKNMLEILENGSNSMTGVYGEGLISLSKKHNLVSATT